MIGSSFLIYNITFAKETNQQHYGSVEVRMLRSPYHFDDLSHGYLRGTSGRLFLKMFNIFLFFNKTKCTIFVDLEINDDFS